MFTFQLRYFIAFIILFIIEVIIAVYIQDNIIRPYVGDLLVVILIYCFFKSFLNVSVLKLGLLVLLFSFLVETLQYFKFIKYLGLQHSKLAVIIFGNSFAWGDIWAYTIGILIVFAIEKLGSASKNNVATVKSPINDLDI